MAIVHDIEIEYASDHETSIQLMAHIFRSLMETTKILAEFKRNLSTKSAWKRKAEIFRIVKNKELEEGIQTINEEIEERKKDIAARNADADKRKEFEEAKGRNPNLDCAENRIKELEKQRTILRTESAELEMHTKENTYSPEEEERGRRAAGEEKSSLPDLRNWKACLKLILESLLQTGTAKINIERMCITSFDLERDHASQSELDFAKLIEKELEFAEWVARIFKEGDVLDSDLERYRSAALTTFLKNLRLSESAGWKTINPAEEDAFRKVLVHLRNNHVISRQQTVPTLPVKREKFTKRRQEEEEEEEEPRIPKKKKEEMSVAEAVVAVMAPFVKRMEDDMKTLRDQCNSIQDNNNRGNKRFNNNHRNDQKRSRSDPSVNFTPLGNRKCHFGNRCNRTNCHFDHPPKDGNNAHLDRKQTFTKKKWCMTSHDGGECRWGEQCMFKHGKSAAIAENCEHVKKGQCERFFTQEGCTKNHKS